LPQKLKIDDFAEPDAASPATRAAQDSVQEAEQAVAAKGRARIDIGKLDLWWVNQRCEPAVRNSFRLENSETPRFGLIQFGMCPGGHTASLFPRTHALNKLDRLAVAGQEPEVKHAWRIALPWPVANHASHGFLLIAGTEKAQILSEVSRGPRNVECLPSQLIAPAGGILTLLLDQAGAALLPPADAQGYGHLERNA